jgi:hypothetical protein
MKRLVRAGDRTGTLEFTRESPTVRFTIDW